MNPDRDHVCIKHPCEYCEIRSGDTDTPGSRPTRVLPFRLKQELATLEERLVERIGCLSPAQRAAVEALVDLYLE